MTITAPVTVSDRISPYGGLETCWAGSWWSVTARPGQWVAFVADDRPGPGDQGTVFSSVTARAIGEALIAAADLSDTPDDTA